MNDIVKEATSWLGTPYHHSANVKGAGVDCAMLLVAVYHACGRIPLIDPRPYSPEWHLHRGEEKYLGWLNDYAVLLDEQVDKPRAGDVAIWRFGRAFSHAGIMVSDSDFVHALMSAGQVTLGSLAQSAWSGAARARKFYRVNEVTHEATHEATQKSNLLTPLNPIPLTVSSNMTDESTASNEAQHGR